MDKRLEIVLAAKDATGKVFKGMQTRLMSLQKTVFSLKGAFAGLVGGYGLAKVTGSFLDAARTTENYETRLKVLLGSVEKGKRLFDEMADYAGRVPFEYQEIMGAATQLAGVMKGGVEEISQWMPMIGDLAAASGLSIGKTTEQVIRMYSAGAASADLFRERGVLAMMGFKAGVSYSAEETRKKMFQEWKKAGSQFKGATDELSKTWDGLISMYQDKWFDFRKTVMESGPFMVMKDQTGELLKELDRFKEEGKIDLWALQTADVVIRSFEMMAGGAKYFLNTIKGIELAYAGFWTSTSTIAKKFAEFMLKLEAPKLGIRLDEEWKKYFQGVVNEMGHVQDAGAAMANDLIDSIIATDEHFERFIQRLEKLRQKINQNAQDIQSQSRTKGPTAGTGGGLPSPGSGSLSWLEQYSRGLTDIAVEAPPLDTRYYDSWKKAYDARKQLKEDLTDDIKRLSLDELEYEEWVYQEQLNYLKQTGQATDEILDMMAEKHQLTMDKLAEKTEKTLGQEMRDAFKGWASDISKELTDLAFDAEASFDDIALSWSKMVAQMSIQKGFVEPSFSWMSGIFSNLFGSAQGNVFLDGMVQKFGKGAVFTKPYIFPMAHGAGIIAETGKPEGVLPLTRMPSGNLGVEAMNGGVQIDVHIHNNKAGTDISMEQSTQNGQPRLDIFIDDIMSEKIFSGKTGKALRTGYGLYPTLVAR